MRSSVFHAFFILFLSVPAQASPESVLFGDMLRSIVESSRYYEGAVEFELNEILLDTSACLEIPSQQALEYFYENVIHHDIELMGPKQRAIASVYFETSDAFIFCEKTEDRTYGEYIEYDSIINLKERDDSFTVIRDFSEGRIIEL